MIIDTKKMYEPAWEYMLMLMSRVKSEEELNDIKTLITKYFMKKADEEMDRLWEAGIVNEEVMNGWLNEHMRTPYKQAVGA